MKLLDAAKIIRRLNRILQGFQYGGKYSCTQLPHLLQPKTVLPPGSEEAINPLTAFFESRHEGKGIWKWHHYFDIYHHHFSKFRGSEVSVLEIGVYSGGSLEMWREYFGPRSRIFGVDIEPACKVYENEFIKIFIGDQADRGFWKEFKRQVPSVDIIIDDGGHKPQQQIVTLEEMLPHLNGGGVYLCEDIHGVPNGFAAYLAGLALNLHHLSGEPPLGVIPNEFQKWTHSITLYPYVTVIEKVNSPRDRLFAQKRGSQWQPFL